MQLNVGGSASQGIDYDFLNPIVKFNPGQTSQTVLVDIRPDFEQEGTETINFELTSLNKAVIGNQNTATLEILDDDVAYVQFSKPTYSVNESNNIVQGAITLTRSGNVSNFLAVGVNVTGGNATQGSDYYLSYGFPSMVYFNPGQTSQTLLLDIGSDYQREGTEAITFEVTSMDNAVIGSQNTATLEIIDDEVPYVEFSKAVYSVNEGGTPQAAITLTRSGNLFEFAHVQLNAIGGNAHYWLDCSIFNPIITFNPGQTSQTVLVDLRQDYEREGTENVIFELTSLNDTVIGNQNTASLEIIDDDVAYVQFSNATYSVNERESGRITQAAITLTRSGDLSHMAQVELNVTGGDASWGTDFSFPYSVVAFNPGETSKTLLMDILPDFIPEGTESVNIELRNWNDTAIIGNQNTATLDIIDADVAYVQFANATYSVNESGIPVQAAITLNRSGDISSFSQVQFNLTGGNADQGLDYRFPAGLPQSVYFNPGETSQTVFVDILPDFIREGTEKVSFELLNPYTDSTVIGSQNTATLEIIDDDVAYVQFSQATYSVNESGTPTQAAITLTRSGNLANFADVRLNVTGGNANQGTDFNSPLTFPQSIFFNPGETSRTVLVDILPDFIREGTETVNFELISPYNYNTVIGSQNTASLEILDDDVAYVEFSQATYSVNESDAPVQAAITLTRSGKLDESAEVRVNISGENASLGTDYNSDFISFDRIFFNPGQTSHTILVNIQPDAQPEGTETLRLGIIEANNAVIGRQNTARVEILDDDALFGNSGNNLAFNLGEEMSVAI